MSLQDQLRKRGKFIYLVIDQSCADDVAAYLYKAANEIDRLTAERDALKKGVLIETHRIVSNSQSKAEMIAHLDAAIAATKGEPKCSG